MERFLLVLLGTALAVQSVYSVVCYVCDSQSTNALCNTTTSNCSISGYVCMTVLFNSNLGSDKPQMVISKSCTTQCAPKSYSVVVASYSVSCCKTDLCNASGAESVAISHLAILIGCLFTFLLHAAGL